MTPTLTTPKPDLESPHGSVHLVSPGSVSFSVWRREGTTDGEVPSVNCLLVRGTIDYNTSFPPFECTEVLTFTPRPTSFIVPHHP